MEHSSNQSSSTSTELNEPKIPLTQGLAEVSMKDMRDYIALKMLHDPTVAWIYKELRHGEWQQLRFEEYEQAQRKPQVETVVLESELAKYADKPDGIYHDSHYCTAERWAKLSPAQRKQVSDERWG
jgi:hypothetical protein